MVNKMFKIFMAAFLCLGSYSFADVQSTRELLSSYSSNNPKVLEVYDRVAKSWVEYEALHEGQWDLEKLLKAVEFSAEKHEGQVRKDAEKTPYIIHPIGVSELLWDIGSIRNVSVLTSALLHDTLEDTDATEAEIETLFGSRVLYTVIEVTNDPTLSSEENKWRQIEHAPMMLLDGQLVKLADRLYNVRDLYPPPPSWSDEKVDGYYMWAEKLLSVLRGTNLGLENALQERIEDYRNRIIGFHTIEKYYFDTDDGKIEDKLLILDNNTTWCIDWLLHNQKHLSLCEGDEVEITSLGDNRYLMVVPAKEGMSDKSILFIKRGDGFYSASRETNGGIIGFHTIENVTSLKGNSVIFRFEDNSYWSIDWFVYEQKHLSLRRGDEVEITSSGENRYLMFVPSKESASDESISFRKVTFSSRNYVASREDNCY